MNFIYIISNGKHYKIGFSKNPKKRLSQLQTGTSDKLSLEYSLNFDIAPIHIIEKIAHRQLQSKISGEWYSENLDTLKAILNYIKIRYDNPETEIEYKAKTLNYFD